MREIIISIIGIIISFNYAFAADDGDFQYWDNEGISWKLSEDWKIEFDEDTLNKNRLYAGLSSKLFKDLRADIFYLWQSGKTGGDWDDLNVLGTKFKLSF